ncbi:MAG TPA: HD domain-containing protein [Chthoniobacteraceae bacterium]|nr:HD domain-containing protein [Chthoniobacteraceae bacterium]
MSNHRSKVFRDAIHGLISIDDDRDLLLDLINTPEFQRLRRVRQLGVSSLTYPNAEHTRFAHSLGVLHVAARILNTLRRRYSGDSTIVSRLDGKRRQVKVAALLHDLGHGPFSHAMERVFDSGKAHEERSQRMFTDELSEIPKVLKNRGFTVTEIAETRDLLEYHEVPFLHDIISSSLDADRMDYLLRDSHFTGVKYGSFDLEWVLNSFCLGQEPAPDVGPRPRLCLDRQRGQHAAEQLIMARTYMTMQVYGHGITRLWEAHLLLLFAEATKLASKGDLPKETPRHVADYFQLKGKVDHAQFLLFDEPSLLTAMTLWSVSDSSTKTLKLLSSKFLNRQKMLRFREIEPPYRSPAKISKLRQELTEIIGPEREGWLLDCYDFTAYKAPDEALQNTEPESYWEGIAKNAILLSGGDLNTPAVPIQKSSLLFKSIGSERMPLTRLFYLPEHEAKVCELDNEILREHQ